jgi:hypothetical protein
VAPVSSALFDGVDATLARPRAAALTTAAGAISALIAALVSPWAGSVAVLILSAVLAAILIYALKQRAAFDGPYRVRSDQTQWDLADPTGQTATVTRSLDVVFNFSTFVIEDFAKGDGDQFATYACNIGHEIHKHHQADRQRVLVLLHRKYERNEAATLQTTRTVTGGFPGIEEWIRLSLDRSSDSSGMRVIFPEGRRVTQVTLTERRPGHETTTAAEIKQVGARQEFELPPKKRKHGPEFDLRWSW